MYSIGGLLPGPTCAPERVSGSRVIAVHKARIRRIVDSSVGPERFNVCCRLVVFEDNWSVRAVRLCFILLLK